MSGSFTQLPEGSWNLCRLHGLYQNLRRNPGAERTVTHHPCSHLPQPGSCCSLTKLSDHQKTSMIYVRSHFRREALSISVRIQVLPFRGQIGGGISESDGNIVITLAQASGLADLDNGGFQNLPVNPSLILHLLISIVMTAHAPDHIFLLKAFSIHDYGTRTQLRKINTAVIGSTDLELESNDLSIFCQVAKTSVLNDFLIKHDTTSLRAENALHHDVLTAELLAHVVSHIIFVSTFIFGKQIAIPIVLNHQL